MKTKILLLFLLISIAGAIPCMAKKAKVKDVMDIIYQVNDYWQSTHPRHGRAFWTMLHIIQEIWRPIS